MKQVSPSVHSNQPQYKDMFNKNQEYNARKKMVFAYLENKSYREVAKIFHCNVKTVMKWVKRYQAGGLKALNSLPRKPKTFPHKLKPEKENEIAELRVKSGFGARRLKAEFELPYSVSAIHRVIKERKLVRKQRKKYQKKRDLREIKMKYRSMEKFQMDVKYLDDIPHYWEQAIHKKLRAKYIFVIRDVKSGAAFCALACEKSKSNAIRFATLFLDHLSHYHPNLQDVVIQTDNGSEFSGNERRSSPRSFSYSVEKTGASHNFIPPRYPNANADVESFNALVEHEFFDIECFVSNRGLLEKLFLYQHWFNLMRKNSYKGYKTPREIIESDGASEGILWFPALWLDPPSEIRETYGNRHRNSVDITSTKLYHDVAGPPVFYEI